MLPCPLFYNDERQCFGDKKFPLGSSALQYCSGMQANNSYTVKKFMYPCQKKSCSQPQPLQNNADLFSLWPSQRTSPPAPLGLGLTVTKLLLLSAVPLGQPWYALTRKV